MKQESIRVEGMSCSACEERIERALARIDGVVRTRADRLKNEVSVVFDPSRATGEQLRSAIEKAGYQVGGPA